MSAVTALLQSMHSGAGRGLSALVLFDLPVCPTGVGSKDLVAVGRRTGIAARWRQDKFESHEVFAALIRRSSLFERLLPGVADLFARTLLRTAADGAGYVLCCPREYEAQVHEYVFGWAMNVRVEDIACPVKAIGGDPISQGRELLVAGLTLVVMIGLSVWGRGVWRLYCVLFAAGLGYLGAIVGGMVTDHAVHSLVSAPAVGVPHIGAIGWSFDPAFALPFAIAGIAVAFKAVGDLSACQRMNDADWKRADMDSISRGVRADAVSTMLAGLFGAMGSSTSSSNIGVAIATGAASRWIGYAAGAVLIVFGFVPKMAAALAVMPTPVMGAVLVFAAGFTIVAGLQLMMSRMIDARRTFVIGISLALGPQSDAVQDRDVARQIVHIDLDGVVGVHPRRR